MKSDKTKGLDIFDCVFHTLLDPTAEYNPFTESDVLDEFRQSFPNTLDTYNLELHSKLDMYFNHVGCKCMTGFAENVSNDRRFLEALAINGIRDSREQLVHKIESHLIANSCKYTPLIKFMMGKVPAHSWYDRVRYACGVGNSKAYQGYTFEFDLECLMSQGFDPTRRCSTRYDVDIEKREYLGNPHHNETPFSTIELGREVYY